MNNRVLCVYRHGWLSGLAFIFIVLILLLSSLFFMNFVLETTLNDNFVMCNVENSIAYIEEYVRFNICYTVYTLNMILFFVVND